MRVYLMPVKNRGGGIISKAQVFRRGPQVAQYYDLPNVSISELPQPDQGDLLLTIDNILVDETLRGNSMHPDDLLVVYPEERFKRLCSGEYHVPRGAERHDGDATRFTADERDNSTETEYIKR